MQSLRFLALYSLAILSACQSYPPPTPVPITEEAGRIELTGRAAETLKVTARRALHPASYSQVKQYAEEIQFEGGYLAWSVLESLAGYKYSDSPQVTLTLFNEWASRQRIQNLVASPQDVKRRSSKHGPYDYIVKTTGSRSCFQFHMYAGKPIDIAPNMSSSGDQKIWGIRCLNVDSRILERDMHEIIESVRMKSKVEAEQRSQTPAPASKALESHSPASSNSTLEEKLLLLRSLHEQGLITPAEYEEKRKKLLSGL